MPRETFTPPSSEIKKTAASDAQKAERKKFDFLPEEESEESKPVMTAEEQERLDEYLAETVDVDNVLEAKSEEEPLQEDFGEQMSHKAETVARQVETLIAQQPDALDDPKLWGKLKQKIGETIDNLKRIDVLSGKTGFRKLGERATAAITTLFALGAISYEVNKHIVEPAHEKAATEKLRAEHYELSKRHYQEAIESVKKAYNQNIDVLKPRELANILHENDTVIHDFEEGREFEYKVDNIKQAIFLKNLFANFRNPDFNRSSGARKFRKMLDNYYKIETTDPNNTLDASWYPSGRYPSYTQYPKKPIILDHYDYVRKQKRHNFGDTVRLSGLDKQNIKEMSDELLGGYSDERLEKIM